MKKKTIVLLVILAVVLIIGITSMFTVRENEYACIVRFT